MTARPLDPNRIALIGFGEVGRRFGREFLETGKFSVATYDILFNNSPAGAALREKARAMKVEACASASAAAEGARIVFSCVTATAAKDVAEEAGSYLAPGQFFVDINSVSPETKRADAKAVARSGANYVECAVMAPVAPYGIKVPILLGGKQGTDLAAILNPAGMKMEMASEVVGQASAIKMCRSIMIKGIEALAVECFLTSRRYGVEETIIASLQETFPQMDWEKLAGYLIGRVVQHGRRRAAEMREVADTETAIGLDPLMASATAMRQDWLADEVVAVPALKELGDEQWREVLDKLIARLKEDAPRPNPPPRGGREGRG
jgi:3-hydroxyisobutyrate dehydrogenase-like beta-hydroxyacid dehydrogenase